MLAGRVLSSVVPALGTKFAMSDTAMLAMLMAALAEEMESGVDSRLADIKTMGEIILAAQAAGIGVAELDSGATLQLDGEGAYTLTRVNELHDALSRILISIHSEVERSEEFSELNRNIWLYLEATSERHKLAL